MYQKVSTDLNFVDREKQVEKFWKDHRCRRFVGILLYLLYHRGKLLVVEAHKYADEVIRRKVGKTGKK